VWGKQGGKDKASSDPVSQKHQKIKANKIEQNLGFGKNPALGKIPWKNLTAVAHFISCSFLV
jgi:hypothetical protein